MNKTINHKDYWLCIQSVLLTTFEDRKIRFCFFFSLIFLSIEILSNIFVPLILKKTVDAFSSPGGLSVTLILVSYGLIWMMSQASLHIRALSPTALNNAFPEMTKIIITHRSFMVDKADQIIALDKNGTFKKVLKNHRCLKNKINFN